MIRKLGKLYLCYWRGLVRRDVFTDQTFPNTTTIIILLLLLLFGKNNKVKSGKIKKHEKENYIFKKYR